MWKWKGRQIAQLVLNEPNEPMKSIRSGPTDCSIKGLTVFFSLMCEANEAIVLQIES